MFTGFSAFPVFNAINAVAHAAVPQAKVLPAPLSQTLTLIFFLSCIFAKVTFTLSGKYLWFSIIGPILIKSLSEISLKKTICGFPTFNKCPSNKFSLTFIFKGLSFTSLLTGISDSLFVVLALKYLPDYLDIFP